MALFKKVWHLHTKGFPLFEQIRKLLFLIVLLITGIAAYNIYINYSEFANLSDKVKLSKNGADIQIEKFKIIHEESGHKNWELKADHAEMDNKKKLVKMTKVQLEFKNREDQTYWISADNGILKNDTKEFQLEGRVRLVTHSKNFFRKNHSSNNGLKGEAQ